MTYPQAEEILSAARTIVQGAQARTNVLQTDISSAFGHQGDLVSQIPPMPLGGYTEEPKEEFVNAVNAASAEAVAISARIPEE